MDAALGLVSVLGFLICIVMLIFSAIKKTGKVKKFAIGSAACFVVFVIAVSMPSTPASKTTSTTPDVTKVADKTPEQIAAEKAESAKITDSDKALLIMSQYKLFSEDELKHFAEIENKYFNYLTDTEKAEVKADFERLYAQKEYQAWIKGQFSAWDGSHRGLVDLLKRNLNDPGSFKHEETTYKDMKDHLIIKMKYRAKNGFGALVLQSVTAKSDYKTNVISVISQND